MATAGNQNVIQNAHENPTMREVLIPIVEQRYGKGNQSNNQTNNQTINEVNCKSIKICVNQ